MNSDINILCADWGKEPRKRSVWGIRSGSSLISPVTSESGTSLESILSYAKELDGPVLVGVDAAIGAPAHIGVQFSYEKKLENPDFFEWINWLFEHGEPDTPVSFPDKWSITQPFIAVPPGKGSLNAFPEFGINLTRSCENGLGAKSPIIVSGIPGTVGSGSREIWRELSALVKNQNSTHFKRWPFDGPLDQLLKDQAVVLAEIYPKVCYGLALSSEFPAKLIGIAKTKRDARKVVIQSLIENVGDELFIENMEDSHESEDDFDAMISVVAIYRLLNSDMSLEPEGGFDSFEGAILGKSALI